MKKNCEKTFFAAAIVHPLWAKVFKYEITSFHYFFPKDSKNLKSLNSGLWEVGAKRLVNWLFYARRCYTLFLVTFNISETTSFNYFSQRILDFFLKKLTSEFGMWGQKDVQMVPQKCHTDTHMDKWIFRKHWPRGVMI